MAQANPELTFSDIYVTPPKFSVEFFDVEKRSLHKFDAFDPTKNDFTVTNMTFTLGAGQSGSCSIDIDDSLHRVIDREIFDCGGFAIIHGGRNASDLTRMFYGTFPTIGTNRRGATGFKYSIRGVGIETLLASILMNVVIKAPVDPTNNQFIPGVQFQAKNVIKNIFNNPNYMIPATKRGNFEGDTLTEATGITTNGISEDLVDMIFDLDLHQTSASQVLSSIEDQLNIDIFVDAFGDLQAKYPTDLHSGMVIKTVEEEGDSALLTGYVQGEHDFEDTIASSDYASRLMAIGRLTSSTDGSTDESGFLSLYNKDIAQQIPVTALRLDNAAIIIQRVGAGTNTANPVTYQWQGAILEDEGDYPSGTPIAKFFIPITKIPQNPTQYQIGELVRTNIRVDVAKKYWLALYEVGNSDKNTIRWYHDGDAGREIKKYPNAIRPLPQGRTTTIHPDRFERGGWRLSWTGPTFSYIFSSKDSHELVMKATAASKRWGRRDARVSSLQQGVSDSSSMIGALGAMLDNSARKERTYDFPAVTIPLKFFLPGYVVNFVDPPIGITRHNNYSITLDEVTYSQDSKDGIGNPWCRITAHKKLRPNQCYLKTKLIQ